MAKGSRKNNFPSLGVDPSRLAALLVPYIPRVCAVLEPCQTGVSVPQNGKLFLREPLVRTGWLREEPPFCY